MTLAGGVEMLFVPEGSVEVRTTNDQEFLAPGSGTYVPADLARQILSTGSATVKTARVLPHTEGCDVRDRQ